MPLVSVILPTYNRQATVARAIQSVLRQTFSDFELIVVDDASTDGTEKLVGGIADQRLRYLRLSQNRGPAGARNAGIATAVGAWVAFQDSDDEWLDTKLEQQLAVARDAPDEVGLVLGGYVVAGRLTMQIQPQRTLAGEDPRPDLLDGWPIITPTWLVRRELLVRLGGFDESYPCLEDWDLVFRLSDSCKFRAVRGPIMIKHSGVNSVCGDPGRMCRALERILQTHPQRWTGEPARFARRLAHLGCLQFRLGRRDEARQTLRRARKHAPAALATHGLLLASYAGARAMRIAERLWPRYAGMEP